MMALVINEDQSMKNLLLLRKKKKVGGFFQAHCFKKDKSALLGKGM